ncbi:MAG: hypothetical protein HUJ25_12090 [Crocinitomicaceae bacterium]|nr:hypothetical protein [Crocinitomicaceae bacterium]
MGKNDIKRQTIFETFSNNLKLVRRIDGVGEKTEEIKGDYICPICSEGFNDKDLNQNTTNPLTLEDVPPKSLGGKQIALTCEKCNNGLGEKIDWHLAERLKELEFKDKKPFSQLTGKFTIDKMDLTVNGKIVYNEKGETQNHYSKKNNNPKTLDIFLSNTKRGTKIHFDPKPSRVDPKKIQIGLLKNAYLLMFEKFGYSFILNAQFDRIREQLRNPTQDIYPLNCWFQGPFPKEHLGVSFITEKGLESIFVLFELKTKKTNRIFAVILPLIDNDIEHIINELSNRFEKENSLTVKMAKYHDDYLKDEDSIKLLVNWMRGIKH